MSGSNSSKIAKRCLSLETARAAVAQPTVAIQQAVKPARSSYKHAACYSKCSDIHIASGKGCYVRDVNGKEFLDVTSGIAVLSTGHCHPKVVEAVQRQAGTLMHGQLNCYSTHTPLEQLLEKLGPQMAHEDLNTFVVDTTGTQANEAAVKLARRYTNKPNIFCVHGGFHGRSALTSAMTSSNAGARYPVATPLPSGVYFTSAPLAFRWGCSEEEAVDRAVANFEDILSSQVPVDQIAAFVCEPVLGEGGFLPLPEAYLKRISKICRANGILMIADEVQAGVGRSGKMWASQHYSLDAFKPDILVAAKGIASGMPLSLIASSEEIMSVYTPGTHGGTYMGNAVACAAAVATLEVIEEEGLIENSRRQGALLKNMLCDARDQFFPDSDVRGSGLMIGLELKWNGKHSPEMAKFIRAHCLENGVLLYAPSGWDGCTLRVMPPLITREPEIVFIATAIEAAARDWVQKQTHSARSA